MPLHARPHLSTHTRGHGHSAVAGAAYRLGLRLQDRRTGEWHDYRKRALGEEIVRALTVAPPGAPDWATDPDQLWNAAEAAEKRKDAQLARDFRIPIPFGLTDEQAGDLAEEVARFIAATLSVPVSMGLHRDAERDAIGELKADAKLGFHAHLYFTTRKIQCWTGDGPSPTELGFGEKLVELAYKKTSGPIVELLNQRWSELSNDKLLEANLAPDRDHRSYARLGIDKVREPKMGQAATAMERQGFFTDRGDSVRAIRVPSEVAALTHAELLQPQRRQAASDHVREAIAHVATAPDEVRDARERGAQLQDEAQLVDRFAAAMAAPTPATRPLFVKLLAVVRRLQRVISLLVALVPRQETARGDCRRTSLAHWQSQLDLDEARARQERRASRVAAWTQEHQWRVKFMGLMGARRRPDALRSLEAAVDDAARQLKETEVRYRRTQAMEQARRKMLRRLEQMNEKSIMRLEESLAHLAGLDPVAAEVLRHVASPDQRPWIDRALPEEHTVEEPTVTVAAEMDPALRPRPRPRM